MKKTKFVALALTVALVLTGTAFAWGWGETLTMDQTLETGNLDVDITYAGVYGSKDVVVHKPTIENDGSKLTTKASNLYPGAQAEFAFQVTNRGSIPAKITDARLVRGNDTKALHDKLWVEVINKNVNTGDKHFYNMITVGGDEMGSAFEGLTLEAGETTMIYVTYTFDKNGSLTGSEKEEGSLDCTLDLDWAQVNEGVQLTLDGNGANDYYYENNEH